MSILDSLRYDNQFYFWLPQKCEPFQVFTPSVELFGYGQKYVPEHLPTTRLVALAYNANHELIDKRYNGAIRIMSSKYQRITADFVTPEGAARMYFGLWIHPIIIQRGSVYFSYFAGLDRHVLAGQLLDEALTEKIVRDPFTPMV